jgi:hypothetical protein
MAIAHGLHIMFTASNHWTIAAFCILWMVALYPISAENPGWHLPANWIIADICESFLL